jgi:RND family efflux transporter MFP subunit
MNFPACSVTLFALLTALFASGCTSADSGGDEPNTRVSVETGAVVRATLFAHVTAFGTVDPAPASDGKPGGSALLSAPLPGVVREVPVHEGARVQTGDIVARLDDRAAQAEWDRANARVTYARQTLDRERSLLASNNTSQKTVEEAEQTLSLAEADLKSAEGALAEVQLRSPLDGVVARLHVSPGQSVDANSLVAVVVDATRLVVSAHVPASEAGQVKVGQAARVMETGENAAGVEAKVSFVSPVVEAESGTVLVRLALPDEHGIPAGTFVRIVVDVEEHRDRLAVPLESVYMGSDGTGRVHVVEGDSAYQRPVQVGLRDRGLIEIAGEGIQEGTVVVTTGSYALPETTSVVVQRTEGQ